ncbi:MAG: ATP-binding protein [bacterium]
MKNLLSFKLKIGLGMVLFTALILLGFSAYFLSATQRIGLARIDRELDAMGIPQINRFHPSDHWAQLDNSLRFLHENGNKGVYEFRVCTPDGTPIYTSRQWPTNVTEKTLGIPDNTPFTPESPPPRRNQPDDFQGSRDNQPPPKDEQRDERRDPPENRPPPPQNLPQPRFMTLTGNDRSWRMMTMKNQKVYFVMALDLAEFQSELHSVQALFTLAIPVSLFLLAIGGWLLAGQALRPVKTLTRVARQITAKDLHQRVPGSKADPEFEELIDILNGMLDRLEKSFQQATRFSADAAHELNTPLTILQGQMEQAIQNASSESDQQQYAGLLEEVQRLKTIVRKLLLMAKADTGQLKLSLERMDLSGELDTLLHDADVLAPGLKLDCQISPGIAIMADPDLFRQVLQNLLSNAIKYNRPDGLIGITLCLKGELALLTISNTTLPGLNLDEKLLFTRFYRGDSSRSRRIEGIGLGLSLAREIVIAHQGTLSLKELKEGWVSFALTVPCFKNQGA